MITFIRQPNRWLIASLLTIILSIVIIVAVRPVWGIDFVGGSLIEIEADSAATDGIHNLLVDQFKLPASIQTTNDGSLIIRTNFIDETTHASIIAALREKGWLTGQERRFETVGPTIGQELRRKSLVAVSLVIVGITTYLAYSFRGTKGLVAPWKFGVAAVYALIHDLILVTALFVIFGKIWGAPVDTLFVTAQLAILGYSVNDTIILFDRLKKEWLKNRSASLLDLMNKSMWLTLGRTLNTSFCILLTLLALLFFGGSTIRWFIVALTAGTITGTYSSLFVAGPLLNYLAKRERPRR